MVDFTIVIPYFNGQETINKLLDSIPADIPVIVVDDQSDEPAHYHLNTNHPNTTLIEMQEKGYFSGAINTGIASCSGDVLVLNQDAVLKGDGWLKTIEDNRYQYAMIGEGIAGGHPAWPNGYIHGTFMFLRRDGLNTVGPFNQELYPLWGSTCEYQLRLCRAGFKALPIRPLPGLIHDRSGRFGSAIQTVLQREADKRSLFIRTPPEISVIVPCFNYGRYLPDLVHSLIGGETSLGYWEQQTFASFEIIIVDDASTDDTPDIIRSLVDPWVGVKSIRLNRNEGTASAINAGIAKSLGNYVTIMGADDMREPWALEALYKVQTQKPDHYVYDQILAFAFGERRPDINVRVREFNPKDLIHRNHVHCGIMMPKRAWRESGGYPNVMRDGREDWAMNVNLLYHGWCGIFVDAPGYLYRREKQNRTLKNTTPTKWREFKARIMQMFPELYHGEIDMGNCCGGGGRAAKSSNKSAAKSSGKLMIPGGGDLVNLEYIGGSWGKITFYGPITGAQYAAGLSAPIIPVDKRDLYGPNVRQVGMLERQENGKKLFRLVQPPKAPQPIPEPEKVPEVPEVPENEPATQPVAVNDISKMTLSQIKQLSMKPEEWAKLVEMEKMDRNRKSVIEFAQSKASEPA